MKTTILTRSLVYLAAMVLAACDKGPSASEIAGTWHQIGMVDARIAEIQFYDERYVAVVDGKRNRSAGAFTLVEDKLTIDVVANNSKARLLDGTIRLEGDILYITEGDMVVRLARQPASQAASSSGSAAERAGVPDTALARASTDASGAAKAGVAGVPEIPSQFQGSWSDKCAGVEREGATDISEKEISGWEYSCSLQKVTLSTTDRFVGDFECHGEGETWPRAMQLRLNQSNMLALDDEPYQPKCDDEPSVQSGDSLGEDESGAKGARRMAVFADVQSVFVTIEATNVPTVVQRRAYDSLVQALKKAGLKVVTSRQRADGQLTYRIERFESRDYANDGRRLARVIVSLRRGGQEVFSEQFSASANSRQEAVKLVSRDVGLRVSELR